MFNENDGSYALQGNNIVHETVNLFQADNGKHYLYIVPGGQIPANKRKVDYVLLVRAFSKGIVQVVALAKDLTYRYDEESNKTDVKYGGKSLIDIFEGNTENDNQYLTYEAGVLYQPRKTILIQSTVADENQSNAAEANQSYGEDVELITVKSRVRNQSMRLFLSDDDTGIKQTDYQEVLRIIQNKACWVLADYKKVNETPSHDVTPTFMGLIGKADNEIAFSNLFSAFFKKYPEIFLAFLKKYGSKPCSKAFKTEFRMEREKNHIDMYVTDGIWSIIIENKIKSGINGVKSCKDDNGRIISQLSNYISGLKEKGVDEKNIECFLFQPNYIKFDLTRFSQGEKYRRVSYLELYNLFLKFEENIKDEDKEYFQLFLSAMKKHTKERDTDIEERMIARFKKRISQR